MAKIPVFVVHGFLESGKTRFVQETLADDYFSGGERNLVIACEEGVEEYEDELLPGRPTPRWWFWRISLNLMKCFWQSVRRSISLPRSL